MPITSKKFYIITYGCQMNHLETEVMTGRLIKMGYELATSEENSDIIILNTCAIRDLAETKAMNKILTISSKNKDAILGITGCMTMVQKEQIFKTFPNVDFILNPDNLHKFEETLIDVINNKNKICLLNKSSELLDYSIIERKDKIKAYVSIIKGCNNFCTYCVVPYTRGKKISRAPQSIINECAKLIEEGFKEIVLLGQNVTSYGHDFKENNFLFSDLLYELDKIKDLKKISFLTSHPKDLTPHLITAIKDLDSICKFIHLPVQSGSSKILKKMNRRYTKEDYIEKVMKLKEQVPAMQIGTDIIVGFPEETYEDFEETIELFNIIKFSQAFVYAYSPRKNTPAEKMTQTVSEKEKKQRITLLLNIYKYLLKKENMKRLNEIHNVLVEKENKNKILLKGRTHFYDKVIFKGNKNLIGSYQKVILKDFNFQTFIGEITAVEKK